jgi:thiol:disulfide interchange protein DsbD
VWGWGWLSRELFLFLWAAIFLVAMAYLFGWVRMKDENGSEDEATVSPKRMVGGFATGLFAMYCLYGGLGHSVDPVMTAIIPNYSSKLGGEAKAEQVGHVIIKDDFEAAVARAKQEGKLVLVNFTGFT